MATLTVRDIIEAGIDCDFQATNSGGDVVPNDGEIFLLCKNGHASGTRTVTVTPQTTSITDPIYGPVTKAAVTLTDIPAGVVRAIGPFKPSAFNNASGQIVVTYSDSSADITVAPLSFNQNKTA